MNGGKKICDLLLGNVADFKSAVAFWRKCIGIEGNKRVSRALLLERVVQGEEPREVGCVCYECGPYLTISAFVLRALCNVSQTFLRVCSLSSYRMV